MGRGCRAKAGPRSERCSYQPEGVLTSTGECGPAHNLISDFQPPELSLIVYIGDYIVKSGKGRKHM